MIDDYDDALSALRRLKAFGAFSVKSYNQQRRDTRQMIIKAARELQMEVVPEGGSLLYMNESMILDGHTTVEHSLPVPRLYKDVVTLFAKSKTGYTPTLIVGYGGLSGEYYWYQKTNVWENEQLLAFTPREVVDARSRRRTMAPDDDFNHILVAKGAKQVLDAGGSVQLGAHGQLQGLGAHWELWMLQQGGMTQPRGDPLRDDQRRDGARPRQRARLDRDRQARRSDRARQEPAREHPQQRVDRHGDAERAAVRPRSQRSRRAHEASALLVREAVVAGDRRY